MRVVDHRLGVVDGTRWEQVAPGTLLLAGTAYEAREGGQVIAEGILREPAILDVEAGVRLYVEVHADSSGIYLCDVDYPLGS